MRISNIALGLAVTMSGLSRSAEHAASVFKEFNLLFPVQTTPKNKPNRISQKKRRLNKRRLG